MAIVGYARVSSMGQSLEVQLEALKAAGCEKIFFEKKTGTTTKDREALEEAIAWSREGDVFLFTRIDRLARSATDLLTIVDRLGAKEVGVRAINQPEIDTTTSHGRLLIGVLAVIAQFETEIRKERQMEGIARAKAGGKRLGRLQMISVEMIERLAEEGKTAIEVGRLLKCSRGSVYRLVPNFSELSSRNRQFRDI